ncbi:uncharacterized protein RSE6_13193 [Rhynchosporium secalis]|uniref:Uncharacterized protein n=1 Tax=Rhynchosporium secalis TaxID=38038 RepID=A0A1E1MS99_RHYSE|nr:uncharacterized protein RSE6_13193 [Rhynchosporium secalis]
MLRRPRRVIYILVALLLLYLLIAYEPVPLPVLARAPKKVTYDARPTYEYLSLYRQKADLKFEAIVDEKLRSLEREIIKGLPNNQTRDTLVTNLTIWQLTNKKTAAELAAFADQWRDNNKDWIYQLFTGTPGGLYEHFESVPEIANVNFTSKTVQDDLTRYLLLWFHGGFYASVETWNRLALRDCSPIATVLQHHKNTGLMIGVDRDEPYLSDATLKDWQWARGVGFGQTAMWAAVRFDPIIRKAIVRTISHAWTHEDMEKGTWREKYTAKVEGAIMEKLTARVDYSGEISGNGMLTDIILETLSATLKKDHKLKDPDAGLEKRVTWRKFWKLREVLWIDRDQLEEGSKDDIRGLTVLPINVWGSGKSHSRSGAFDSEEACINHSPNWRPPKDLKKKIFG